MTALDVSHLLTSVYPRSSRPVAVAVSQTDRTGS